MSDYELSLDEEQLRAVEFDGSQLVEAGPGSGKTRMLTEKARRLMKQKKNIICVCFTRAAASEMASRVPMLPATTIHSYCCGNVGWKEEWAYDGLLYRFLHMEDKPRFDWVLCDEVQDLNEMEFDVILSLIGEKVFAVGDPFQSIYGFQGAMGDKAFRHLRSLGCEEFKLHNNYRSSESIVRRLNGYFSRDLVSRGVKDIGTSAVLTRTNEALREAHRLLQNSKIPHKVRWSQEYAGKKDRESIFMDGKSLILSTCHSAKGHEFDKVILYKWKPERYNYGDQEEERVYYVAMSRASKEFLEARNPQELVSLVGG